MEESWLELAPDGVVVTVPASELEPLLAALDGRARRLPAELLVEVQGEDGARELGPRELGRIVDEAADTCHRALADREEERREIGDAEAIGLAEAAGILATVWSFAAQSDLLAPADDAGWIGTLTKLTADFEDMFTTRIRPRADGSYALRWGILDRKVARDAFTDLLDRLGRDDADLARLFPAPYGSDDERNAGWDVLAKSELIDHRRSALGSALRLLGETSCDPDELTDLMKCLNDGRLVLGTRLDVGEDGGVGRTARPHLADALAYERLTHLVAMTVEALETDL